MVLILLATVLIAVIAFFQVTQGFYSAMIMAVVSVLSAAVAMAFYEPLAALLRPHQPDAADAIALLGIFIVLVVGLRLACDIFLKRNVVLGVWTNRLGGGVLGSNAARSFLGLGAQVTILNRGVRKLRHLDDLFGGRVMTMLSNEYNLKRVVEYADVLVGCVLVPGRRAPVLVSRDLVRRMRPGSAVIDFSIDQGGCVETRRPTTLRDQTFVEEEGVIHHCVPYVTATVARTASYALTNAALPYLLAVGACGLPAVFDHEPALTRGVNLYRGRLTHPEIAASLGREVEIEIGAQFDCAPPPGGTT